jgi:hypothetical protein
MRLTQRLTPTVLQEQEQLAALRAQQSSTTASSTNTTTNARDDIEGGFGGQEDLEDRYATTSGEH